MTSSQAAPETNVRCVICGGETRAKYALPDRLYGTPGTFSVRECQACGCGVTSPLVREEDLGEYYRMEYYTHSQPSGLRAMLQNFDFWRRARRHGLDSLVRGKMLEIGPGDCGFLRRMRQRSWKVAGLDPDPAIVANGTAQGFEMHRGTVSSIPPEMYDLIVAWHSLEHSVDPARDIALLAEHLAPQGRLLIGVPDFGSAIARRFREYWFGLEVPRHRVHFTRRGLELALQRAGLRIVCRRFWLSAYTTMRSWQYERGTTQTTPLATAATMAFSPLCWTLESFGYADSISVVAQRQKNG